MHASPPPLRNDRIAPGIFRTVPSRVRPLTNIPLVMNCSAPIPGPERCACGYCTRRCSPFVHRLDGRQRSEDVRRPGRPHTRAGRSRCTGQAGANPAGGSVRQGLSRRVPERRWRLRRSARQNRFG